jgi:replicative DNA helicase
MELPELPRTEDNEASLLAVLMHVPELVDDCAEIASREDFYSADNAIVFDAICQLRAKNRPTDMSHVANHLQYKGKIKKIGGRVYLAQILDTPASKSSAIGYATNIRDKAILRQIIYSCHKIAQQAADNPPDVSKMLDAAETEIMDIRRFKKGGSFVKIEEAVMEVWKDLENKEATGNWASGIPSGYSRLDAMTTGFKKGEFIILAGRPSSGKTSMAMDFARHAAVEKRFRVAFFSLEMSNEQLSHRLLAAHWGVDAHRLRSGKLQQEDWAKMSGAMSFINGVPLWILDVPRLSLAEIRAKARREKTDHQTDMIIIDYLGLINPPHKKSREQEVAAISAELKGLARELDVPVIALSQMSRAAEKREDTRPRLSDLRDSGALEQDADMVLFVYRPEMYSKEQDADRGRTELILAKQRNGPTGTVELRFFRESMLFREGGY